MAETEKDKFIPGQDSPDKATIDHLVDEIHGEKGPTGDVQSPLVTTAVIKEDEVQV